jgi:hypothetical protein
MTHHYTIFQVEGEEPFAMQSDLDWDTLVGHLDELCEGASPDSVWVETGKLWTRDPVIHKGKVLVHSVFPVRKSRRWDSINGLNRDWR